jgi:Polyketide cyclase / dehydrase and lipid transport
MRIARGEGWAVSTPFSGIFLTDRRRGCLNAVSVRRKRRPSTPEEISVTSQKTTRARMLTSTVASMTALLGVTFGTGAAQAEAAPAISGHDAGAAAAPNLACAGKGIDTTAPVISTGEILIHAPLSTVYDLQTDVNHWTAWRSDVDSAQRLDHGPLRAGSSFRWETGGLTVVSTLAAVQANRCTTWGGPAAGIQGEHVWTYTKVKGGTLVRTAESWSGAPVTADVPGAQALLDASLAQWRQDLKATAEARTPCLHGPELF